MSKKFFTNQGQNTLLKKFEGIFKHTKVNSFDALVGYLRASGYFSIRKYLKKVPKVRILVGINVDKVIKKFHKVGLEFSSNSEKILEEFKEDLIVKFFKLLKDKRLGCCCSLAFSKSWNVSRCSLIVTHL